jgi:hypothetical protein
MNASANRIINHLGNSLSSRCVRGRGLRCEFLVFFHEAIANDILLCLSIVIYQFPCPNRFLTRRKVLV